MNRIEILKDFWHDRHESLFAFLDFTHYSGPNATGKITRRTKQKCYSYVINCIDILRVHIGQVSTAGIVDTGGTSRTVGTNTLVLGVTSAAANNAYGIQLGTGTTAVAITQTAMVTLIAEGAAATQLNYGATSVSASATVGTTRRFTVARTVTNNSGGTITIQEVGLVWRADASAWNFLAERSLSTQAILNLASATATYTIGVTV